MFINGNFSETCYKGSKTSVVREDSGRIFKQSINSKNRYKRMEKKISVTRENREFLMKAFGVTERMVFKALAFQSDTDLAKKIRRLALQRGGFIVNIGPAMECFHDSDNFMYQYLPNGAILEFNKNTGSCDAFFEGECVKHWDGVMTSVINDIQNWAGALK